MKRYLPLLLAGLLCLFSGCGIQKTYDLQLSDLPEELQTKTPEGPEPDEPEPPEAEPDAVQSVLDGLSLEEKVGQLFLVRCPESHAAEDVETYHLGGYVLFGRDTKDRTADVLIQTIDLYQQAADIPLLIAVDEEGGTVVRISSNAHFRAEKFPAPQTLWQAGRDVVAADTHEKDLLLRSLGINVNLAPVADVSTDPKDFIYKRTIGEDAAATSEYISIVVDAMSRDRMGCVLKHFPGYGSNTDTHTGPARDDRPMETFLTSDFLPFQAGFAAGALAGGPGPAVLFSHNIVTAMDPDLPASLSSIVHRLLREDLGYDGVILTDDLAMDAVASYNRDGGIAVLALQAGNDLIITTDYRTQIPKVLEALESGELDPSVIDAACYRVLRWKMELGLLTPEV